MRQGSGRDGGERTGPKSVTPLDERLGRNIRLARIDREVSQRTLADACGVSLAQLQKYEAGSNRLPATRLYLIAQKLDLPADWFFGLHEAVLADGGTSDGADVGTDDLAILSEDVLFLALQIGGLPKKVRKAVSLLVEVVKS